jgi:hypothetical protein
MTKRTQVELVAELEARFGADPMDWAFVCPTCKTVIRGRDIREALDAAGRKDEYASRFLGQDCIGRIDPTQGCNYAAYGLFRGPDVIVMPDGHEAAAFAIAPALEGTPA